MAINKAGYRRKQYFIATRFQLKYVGLILALMFLTAAFCSYIVYYTSMLSMGEKLASVYPQGRLISIVKAVNFRILVSLILITPLVAMIGIFLSHRIAGPIFRMEKFLNGVAAGVLTERLILRKKDELMNLANGINNVVDSVKDSVLKEKECVQKASIEANKLKMIIESNKIDKDVARDLIDKIQNEMLKLTNELEKYRI